MIIDYSPFDSTFRPEGIHSRDPPISTHTNCNFQLSCCNNMLVKLIKSFFSKFSENFNRFYCDEFSFLMRFGAKLTNQRPVLLKLRLRKNNIIADKNRRKFFDDFS